jgi:phytoene dehydrogenase-like protein
VTSTSVRDLLRRPDTTTRERLERAGFSQRMIERFFEPLFAGIQLDERLGTSARLFDLYFRSLATGDAAVPAAGMGAITAQLAAGIDVKLHTPVAAVEPGAVTTADGERLTARAVIVATEGPTAAQLLGLDAVASKSVSCIWFAADEAPYAGRMLALDGERSGPVKNVAPMSSVAPSYAPAGRALVAAAAPGAHGNELVGDATRQLRRWFGATVDRWQPLRVDHITHAQPVQSPGFEVRRRQRITDGLWVAGDHRDTASIQGAMFSGRRCGEAVALALTRKRVAS